MKIITGDKQYFFLLSACDLGHPVEMWMTGSTDNLQLMYIYIYIYNYFATIYLNLYLHWEVNV